MMLMKKPVTLRKVLLFTLLAAYCSCLLSAEAMGQNLVPNGSFEQHSSCPTYLSQLDLCSGWTPLFGTPDYYNHCDPDTMNVPSNVKGFQEAAHGQAYIGVGTYAIGSFFREYVQAELTTPLAIGEPMELTMAVSPGGFSTANPSFASPTLTTRGIGLRFSVSEVPISAVLLGQPPLFADQVLLDTSDWLVLSVTYVPDSAYRYVQIGNFFDDAASIPTPLDTNGDSEHAYAFVDAVCVTTLGNVCDFENPVLENPMPGIGASTLVFTDELVLESGHVGNTRIDRAEILDCLGQIVWMREFLSRTDRVPISTSTWPVGFYYLKTWEGSTPFPVKRMLHSTH